MPLKVPKGPFTLRIHPILIDRDANKASFQTGKYIYVHSLATSFSWLDPRVHLLLTSYFIFCSCNSQRFWIHGPDFLSPMVGFMGSLDVPTIETNIFWMPGHRPPRKKHRPTKVQIPHGLGNQAGNLCCSEVWSSHPDHSPLQGHDQGRYWTHELQGPPLAPEPTPTERNLDGSLSWSFWSGLHTPVSSIRDWSYKIVIDRPGNWIMTGFFQLKASLDREESKGGGEDTFFLVLGMGPLVQLSEPFSSLCSIL